MADIEARYYCFISEGKPHCHTVRSSLSLLTFSDDPHLVDVNASVFSDLASLLIFLDERGLEGKVRNPSSLGEDDWHC